MHSKVTSEVRDVRNYARWVAVKSGRIKPRQYTTHTSAIFLAHIIAGKIPS
jgi:hypothetical protein